MGLKDAAYVVSKVDETEKLDKADAPFKTSTLQQQAAIRLRFSSKRTMKVAQELYEGIDVDGSGPVGLITYMRTDSLRVSDEAVTAVREKIPTGVRRPVSPREADPVRRRQAGAGGARGRPTDRPGDDPGGDPRAPLARPVPALSARLHAVPGQPDGAGGLQCHRRRHHRRQGSVQGPGEGAAVRRAPPRSGRREAQDGRTS